MNRRPVERRSVKRRLFFAEPFMPAHARRPVVVDAGVLAAVLFDEPEREAAARQLAGTALHAPLLLDAEIAHVALGKARAGFAETAAQGLTDFRALALERVAVDPFVQVGLAMSYGITTDDAAYLAVAAKLKAPLVTFDAKLARAARRHLGVSESP